LAAKSHSDPDFPGFFIAMLLLCFFDFLNELGQDRAFPATRSNRFSRQCQEAAFLTPTAYVVLVQVREIEIPELISGWISQVCQAEIVIMVVNLDPADGAMPVTRPGLSSVGLVCGGNRIPQRVALEAFRMKRAIRKLKELVLLIQDKCRERSEFFAFVEWLAADRAYRLPAQY
jgi:hypothetical protein